MILINVKNVSGRSCFHSDRGSVFGSNAGLGGFFRGGVSNGYVVSLVDSDISRCSVSVYCKICCC